MHRKPTTSKRPRRGVSATNDAGRETTTLARGGRPNSFERVNRLKFTRLVNQLLIDSRACEAWFEAAITDLREWSPKMLRTWDLVMLMVSEIGAAGQTERDDERGAVQAELPFTIADAITIARAAADGDLKIPYSGDATLAILLDLLYRNVFPLAMTRAAEALERRTHRYHAHVKLTMGQVWFTICKVGLRHRDESSFVRPEDNPANRIVPITPVADAALRELPSATFAAALAARTTH